MDFGLTQGVQDTLLIFLPLKASLSVATEKKKRFIVC